MHKDDNIVNIGWWNLKYCRYSDELKKYNIEWRFKLEYINSKDFKLTGTNVTFGKFDGIHKGHRFLIDELKKQKEVNQGKIVVFTFDFRLMPKSIRKDLEEIYTSKEKREILEALGVDVMIEYPLDQEGADMSPEDFVREVICKKIGAKYLAVGHDFTFGKKAAGTPTLLEKMSINCGYAVDIFEKIEIDKIEVSSTLVRSYLREGKIQEANKLLGMNYYVKGVVEKGKQLGRTIGFPTANVIPEEVKLLPRNGVYATKTTILDGAYAGRVYKGMTNIGVRPTVGNQTQKWVETNFFDCDDDLYGAAIKTEFYAFTRPETNLGSVEALKNRLTLDKKQIEDMNY
jgi:riboflavin kinase/FMN adenylyltransferase